MTQRDEVRNIGAFVLLGQRERAHELLKYFLKDQRPLAWNHWAEVAWRNPKDAKFIGDMPHTWVGSDFIRAIRNMFVYEREFDEALVIGAGILEEWVRDPSGVEVKRLPTDYGTLDYKMKMDGDNLEVELAGDVRIPAGKVILATPLPAGLKEVVVNAQKGNTLNGNEVIVNEFPAKILLKIVAHEHE
jgi:hypothetical protein